MITHEGQFASQFSYSDKEDIIATWQLFNVVLEEQLDEKLKFVVPYANVLAERFPFDLPGADRKFQMLISMIKACALLHYSQRVFEHDFYKIVEAKIADYRSVYNLCDLLLVDAEKTEKLKKYLPKPGLIEEMMNTKTYLDADEDDVGAE